MGVPDTAQVSQVSENCTVKVLESLKPERINKGNSSVKGRIFLLCPKFSFICFFQPEVLKADLMTWESAKPGQNAGSWGSYSVDFSFLVCKMCVYAYFETSLGRLAGVHVE